jgi:hypothetical protein
MEGILPEKSSVSRTRIRCPDFGRDISTKGKDDTENKEEGNKK